MQQMTKQQATEILDNAISQIQTTRDNHIMLQQALAVLSSEPDASPEGDNGASESKSK